MDIPQVMTVSEPSGYYNELKKDIPEELLEKLNPILDKLTIKELRSLASYIQECCYNLEKELHSTVTMEDFEKAKKEDIDGDNEEGEEQSEDMEGNY